MVDMQVPFVFRSIEKNTRIVLVSHPLFYQVRCAEMHKNTLVVDVSSMAQCRECVECVLSHIHCWGASQCMWLQVRVHLHVS